MSPLLRIVLCVMLLMGSGFLIWLAIQIRNVLASLFIFVVGPILLAEVMIKLLDLPHHAEH